MKPSKEVYMLKIGLTGGIGTGKSTISKYLKDLGFMVIDADQVSRRVLELYPEINIAVREKFGNEFFDNNNLKRRDFGNYIFKNKDKLKVYEDIILPYIKEEIFKTMDDFEKNGEKVCFLDAAILIEKGIYKSMDKNLLVWVDKDTQIKRVKERDNMTYDEIESRIKSQMSLDEKRQYVDFVVDNSGSLEDTRRDVHKILESLGLL